MKKSIKMSNIYYKMLVMFETKNIIKHVGLEKFNQIINSSWPNLPALLYMLLCLEVAIYKNQSVYQIFPQSYFIADRTIIINLWIFSNMHLKNNFSISILLAISLTVLFYATLTSALDEPGIIK